MADYGFGKKPEFIRAEPYADFKQVYNRHWGFLLYAGSYSFAGATSGEVATNLRIFYSHLRLMEASLSLFIKDKLKFEEETAPNKKITKEILRMQQNLLVYENQIIMFENCNEWLEKLLPHMRTAGVIPLEDTEETVE